jgi:hypothetical protein
MLVFNKYFYKKKKSKLYFGDRVAVLNDFIYQTGGSMFLIHTLSLTLGQEQHVGLLEDLHKVKEEKEG